MRRITVLLVEDRKLMRQAYRLMLELSEDLFVVGEAKDSRQAAEMVRKLHPDVVLMAIAMPHFNGLEAVHQVAKTAPATQVLLLSDHGGEAYVTEAVKSRAIGYVTKQTSAHTIYRAIRGACRGKPLYSPNISGNRDRFIPQWLGPERTIHEKANELTSREMEVLQLVAESYSNKQTAAELGISIKTVEKHRSKLMKKLNIHDTAGLTRYAITIGVVELGFNYHNGNSPSYSALTHAVL